MVFRRFIPCIVFCVIASVLAGCGGGAHIARDQVTETSGAQTASTGVVLHTEAASDADPTGDVPTGMTGGVDTARLFEDASAPAEVEEVMRRVFAWQLDALGSPEPDWKQATFMIGVVAAYEATGDTAYLGAATRWSSANAWRLGTRELHADDHAPGQVYLDLARLGAAGSSTDATLATLRALVESSESADRIWWWADALFMAPPALARASELTSDPVYADRLTGMWWDAADPLFDGDQQLFHRDAAARDNRDGAPPLSRHGNPAFWSRGNGWVLAGIARTLEFLPDDHEARELLETVYLMMAERLIGLQGDDGLWRTSLLDPPELYQGETSGSALICHALAWGVREGLLDAEEYAPAVLRAWDGLVGSVDGDGRLGWVQGVGRRPGLISEQGTASYGSGTFLLAGSEILKMIEPHQTGQDQGMEVGQ